MKEHPYPLLNHPVDISKEFSNMENTMFLPESLSNFDAVKASGDILWGRYAYKVRMAFNQEGINLVPTQPWEFPSEYGSEKEPYPFSITFYGDRTLRLRFWGRNIPRTKEPSLMLKKEPKPTRPWNRVKKKGRIIYQGPAGSITVVEDPWALEIRDAAGLLVT
jgi:alpha-D-xyloside xylohydrolase